MIQIFYCYYNFDSFICFSFLCMFQKLITLKAIADAYLEQVEFLETAAEDTEDEDP